MNIFITILVTFVSVTLLIIFMNMTKFKNQTVEKMRDLSLEPERDRRFLNVVFIICLVSTIVLMVATHNVIYFCINILWISYYKTWDRLIISEDKISNYLSVVDKKDINSISFIQKKGELTSLYVKYKNKGMVISIFPSKAILVKQYLDKFNYEYSIVCD